MNELDAQDDCVKVISFENRYFKWKKKKSKRKKMGAFEKWRLPLIWVRFACKSAIYLNRIKRMVFALCILPIESQWKGKKETTFTARTPQFVFVAAKSFKSDWNKSATFLWSMLIFNEPFIENGDNKIVMMILVLDFQWVRCSQLWYRALYGNVNRQWWIE